MTFRVQGTINVNGTQAKAEAKAVAAELRKVGTDATGMGRAAGAAGDGARRLGAGSADAAARVRALAAAERQAATDAVTMGRGNQMAAGSIGNLVANFNDIGVMLAAGQNPLQLAIQQGTQITQVFGNMGAASAVKAVGQAFLAMVSPLNLITIGGIAAGAAMLQWLTSAGEETLTLDDRLQDLSDAVDRYAKAAEAARMPSEKLYEAYGRMGAAAKEAAEGIAEAERAKALREINVGAQSFSAQFGGFGGPQGDLIGSEYEETLFSLRSELDLTARDAVNVAQKLEALGRASGPEEITKAATAARNALVEAGVAADQELALALATLAERAARFVATTEEAKGKLVDLGRLVELQANTQRAANIAAEEMLPILQAQEVARNQILIFGRDSELVAQNRLAAEREVLAAQLEAEGVAADLAARVLEAWDAATGFNAEAAGMPGFLSAAAGAAAGIAGNLWNAVKAQVTLKANEQAYAQMKLAADGKVYSGRGGDPRTSNSKGYGEFVYTGPNLDARNNPIVRGGSGGGGKAARDEAEAVADLIEKLRGELDAARELDPVQRAMIGYREQLKNATAAERAEVEGLIVQREREKQLTESLNWLGEQTGDALIDGLMGAADAGERLIDTLKRAVLQALILGNGPLGGLFGGGLFGGGGGGGLFGGGGGGGLFGGLFSGGGLFAGLAEGGMVFGDGGPRDDKVVRRLSAGEFVVNAAATRRHRRLLEAINAPGLANGGAVGGGGAAGGAMALGGSTFNAHFDLRGASDPAEVETAARRGMKAALDEYRRTGLAGDVRRSLDRPEVLRF